MQPSKVLEEVLQDEASKKSKTTSKVLNKPAVLSYEELGGLSDPRPQDCVHNVV
jgi:hypothetical protein